MQQSHEIKGGATGGATDEAFQEQCFLWETGASVGADFDQDLLHAQEKAVNNTLKEMGKKKGTYNMSPLKLSQRTDIATRMI